ncbi:hypothetical protein [Fibrella arboris]|uniref:hypothetical protein n=1 Tax=Fibrella arboris TaxID=3242486 RepID=UPI0035212B34
MKQQNRRLPTLYTLLALLTSAHGFGQIVKSDWDVFSAANQPAALKDTVFQNRPCMQLNAKEQAIAVKKGALVKNVRIDLDIAGEVMSGIGFRVADAQNYQFLYFRPGYGGTREAIQYVPIYNGALSWVLYHAPAYEAAADIKRLEWFHVTMEVKNNNLKVFVNNSPTPQLESSLVSTPFREGGLLLRTLFGTSYFANVTIRELPDVLTNWEISEQFPRTKRLDLDYKTASRTWTAIHADEADAINLCRYFTHPNGVAIARHHIESATDVDKFLYVDFAGKLKIVLNGQELFHYEKQKLDRVFSGTNKIALPLRKGQNELLFITEGDATIFGKGFDAMGRLQHQNWGFIAEVGNR